MNKDINPIQPQSAAKIVKVASQSRVSSVAGAIAGVYRDYEEVAVQAIGASAVNQAIKAIITAREYLAEEEKAVCVLPSFVELTIGGQVRTGIRFWVRPYIALHAPDASQLWDNAEPIHGEYLLREETAVGHLVDTAADEAVEKQIHSYTQDEDIQEDFDERQELAHSGREELLAELDAHHAKSPILSGGDLDAAWDEADVGEETVGGTVPTPDQNVVDDLGEAAGLNYDDEEPLHTGDLLAYRDRQRWELDPRSAEDEDEDMDEPI